MHVLNKIMRISAKSIVIFIFLMALSGCNTLPNDPSTSGETKVFQTGGLEVQITNVYEVQTVEITDDMGNITECPKYICNSNTSITIISADMSDPIYSADGNPHSNWGILFLDGSSMKITDDTPSITDISNVECIFSLESNFPVLYFELK